LAVDHPAVGQPAQNASGCSVVGLGAKPLLFGSQNLRDLSISRTEAKLAIKPEGAGFDGFLIVEA
jgi:hypothetical protein